MDDEGRGGEDPELIPPVLDDFFKPGPSALLSWVSDLKREVTQEGCWLEIGSEGAEGGTAAVVGAVAVSSAVGKDFVKLLLRIDLVVST